MGIDPGDIRIAFKRHTTSKIRTAVDLLSVSSLGFRGEALSSIAAVCQVELITKTAENLTGYRYKIEGGKETLFEEIGAPEGTTFIVKNIFFNTPARRKFLKTAQTEAGYVSDIVEKIALSHPEISISFKSNRQLKIHTAGNGNLKDVIYNVYGREITGNVIEINQENDFMKMTGYIGKAIISKGNRTFENYFINGRYIKSNILSKAIEAGYKFILMQHKYPFTVLNFEINPEYLDVNVHPRKLEVRFARGTEVYDAIYEAVHNALLHRELIPVVPVGKEERVPKAAAVSRGAVPEPFEKSRRPEPGYGNMAGNPVQAGKPFLQNGGKMSGGYGSSSGYPFGSMLREQAVYQAKPFSKEEEALFAGTLKAAAQADEMAADVGKTNDGSSQAGGAPNDMQDKPGAQLGNLETEQSAQTAQSEAYTGKNLESQGMTPVGQNMDKSGMSGLEAGNSADFQPEDVQAQNPGQIAEQGTGFQAADTVLLLRDSESSAEASSKVSDTESGAEPVSQESPQQLELFHEKLLAPESRSRHKLIGQLFDTYWLVEFENQFYIIDQHAAHEKVNYERFVKRFKEQTIESQYLSPPLVVTLNMEEQARLKANEEYFRQYGFEIEPFGGREYCISAVPSNLYGFHEEELFLEMLDNLGGEGSKDAFNLFTTRLATMACKAAVKGNHQMSALEADKLIDELLTLDNPYNCPHGRPTIIAMTKTEIEKKFKRIV